MRLLHLLLLAAAAVIAVYAADVKMADINDVIKKAAEKRNATVVTAAAQRDKDIQDNTPTINNANTEALGEAKKKVILATFTEAETKALYEEERDVNAAKTQNVNVELTQTDAKEIAKNHLEAGRKKAITQLLTKTQDKKKQWEIAAAELVRAKKLLEIESGTGTPAEKETLKADAEKVYNEAEKAAKDAFDETEKAFVNAGGAVGDWSVDAWSTTTDYAKEAEYQIVHFSEESWKATKEATESAYKDSSAWFEGAMADTEKWLVDAGDTIKDAACATATYLGLPCTACTAGYVAALTAAALIALF